jgi:hypothetical protein
MLIVPVYKCTLAFGRRPRRGGTGSRTGNLSNTKLNSDITNYLFNSLGMTTALYGKLNLLSEHAPSTIPSDITMRSQRSSTGEPSDNTTDDAGDISVSSESTIGSSSTIGASSTYSGPILKKSRKKSKEDQPKRIYMVKKGRSAMENKGNASTVTNWVIQAEPMKNVINIRHIWTKQSHCHSLLKLG